MSLATKQYEPLKKGWFVQFAGTEYVITNGAEQNDDEVRLRRTTDANTPTGKAVRMTLAEVRYAMAQTGSKDRAWSSGRIRTMKFAGLDPIVCEYVQQERDELNKVAVWRWSYQWWSVKKKVWRREGSWVYSASYADATIYRKLRDAVQRQTGRGHKVRRVRLHLEWTGMLLGI